MEEKRAYADGLMEARTGIEPVYAALQAAASPLCHLAGTVRWARFYTIGRCLCSVSPGD
jgi:hypothetical protein